MNPTRLTAAAALALGLTFPPLAGAQDQAKQRPDAGMKHPPTAQMDRATPPDRTTTGEPDSAKHPPTSLMDRAAPEQKSPGTTQEQGAPGSTQEERRAGTTQHEKAPGAAPDDQSPPQSSPRTSTGHRG